MFCSNWRGAIMILGVGRPKGAGPTERSHWRDEVGQEINFPAVHSHGVHQCLVWRVKGYQGSWARLRACLPSSGPQWKRPCRHLQSGWTFATAQVWGKNAMWCHQPGFISKKHLKTQKSIPNKHLYIYIYGPRKTRVALTFNFAALWILMVSSIVTGPGGLGRAAALHGFQRPGAGTAAAPGPAAPGDLRLGRALEPHGLRSRGSGGRAAATRTVFDDRKTVENRPGIWDDLSKFGIYIYIYIYIIYLSISV